MRVIRAFVTDLDIHGSCFGSRCRPISARCQPEPRSLRRTGGHERGLEPLIRAGHALSVRGLVLSDSGQAGASVVEPGLAPLGQGLAALPQGQGVLQRDRSRLEALHDGHQLLARPLITE